MRAWIMPAACGGIVAVCAAILPAGRAPQSQSESQSKVRASASSAAIQLGTDKTEKTEQAGESGEDLAASRQPAARARALKQFGGDRRTEQAVADGLSWLAAHQRDDGMWDRVGFEKQCPPRDCCPGGAVERLGYQLDVGVSSLALLAFLGAGHTHRQGPYAAVLERGFTYLLAQQDLEGSFAPGSAIQTYDDALATLAIAEAAALTHDPVFAGPLRRAVAHLARAQQDGGGWDYSARQTGRDDTSISGWVLMAFKSAAAAGVAAPPETIWRMVGHFERAIQSDGQVWYADDGVGVLVDQSTGERRQRFGPAMCAVGLFAHATIGWRTDDPVAEAMSRRLLGDPPSYRRLTREDESGLHSEYYWYHGTLALFQRGGANWAAWNRSLRDCVLEYQERPVDRQGQPKHLYGSWRPFGASWGKWGRMGGRLYSTAMNVITLETYYRYEPAYLSPHGLIGPRELRAWVEQSAPAQRRAMLPRVTRFHADTSEPVLLWLCESKDAALRLDSAIGLARCDSPLARPILAAARGSAKGPLADRIEAALRRLERWKSPAEEYGAVRQVAADQSMVLFDTSGRPLYYGQLVELVRDGAVVASGRVDRRFTARQAAAATLLKGSAEPGDRVRAVHEANAVSRPATTSAPAAKD